MLGILFASVTLFVSTFVYCSMVVAKRSDEVEYKEEEKLNWK